MQAESFRCDDLCVLFLTALGRMGSIFPLPMEMLLMKKDLLYEHLAADLAALLSKETDFIANAANMSALVYERLPDILWAGFYIRRGEELVLGPFQGKPACTRLPRGRGVCWASVERQDSVVVDDVRRFAGHIACDADSRSELVVPLKVDDEILGVFDLDSPCIGRFDTDDQAGVEKLIGVFLQKTSVQALLA
jgi:L-methionine (R)-S-oxide reductase